MYLLRNKHKTIFTFRKGVFPPFTKFYFSFLVVCYPKENYISTYFSNLCQNIKGIPIVFSLENVLFKPLEDKRQQLHVYYCNLLVSAVATLFLEFLLFFKKSGSEIPVLSSEVLNRRSLPWTTTPIEVILPEIHPCNNRFIKPSPFSFRSKM